MGSKTDWSRRRSKPGVKLLLTTVDVAWLTLSPAVFSCMVVPLAELVPASSRAVLLASEATRVISVISADAREASGDATLAWK